MLERKDFAYKALIGISIGDAFGDSFFGERTQILKHIEKREIPNTKWEFTDDTVMAIAVFEQLEKKQTINQDELAKLFAINHEKDKNRGYGASVRKLLRQINEGHYWKELSRQAFDGMGSMGNGASMRSGPIGAFYHDDLTKVKELAIKSSEITHSNIEGITGSIAVAIATALSTKIGLNDKEISSDNFIKIILSYLPESDTKSKISKSLSVSFNSNIQFVESVLGNGSEILAKDTVPFCIWCAAHCLRNYEESLWKAVSVLGDRDTICAIVGGITIMSSPSQYIPKQWLSAVENIENSIFRNKLTS